MLRGSNVSFELTNETRFAESVQVSQIAKVKTSRSPDQVNRIIAVNSNVVAYAIQGK